MTRPWSCTCRKSGHREGFASDQSRKAEVRRDQCRVRIAVIGLGRIIHNRRRKSLFVDRKPGTAIAGFVNCRGGERRADPVHAGMRRRDRHLAGRPVRSSRNCGERAGTGNRVTGVRNHTDSISNAGVRLCSSRFRIRHGNRGCGVLAVRNRVRCEGHRRRGRAAADADSGLTIRGNYKWFGVVLTAEGMGVPRLTGGIGGQRRRRCRREVNGNGFAGAQFVGTRVRSQLDLARRYHGVPRMSGRGHRCDGHSRVIRRDVDIYHDDGVIHVPLSGAGGIVTVRNRDRIGSCGVIHHIRRGADHRLEERSRIDDLREVP